MASIPPGLIGVITGEIGRYSDFLPNIVRLCGSAPPGSDFQKVAGLGPAGPLNELGRTFVANHSYKWLMLVNDDNIHPPGAIQQLWKTMQDFGAGMVTGLYLKRQIPFEPIIFDGLVLDPPPDAPVRSISNRWYRRYFTETGRYLPTPIVACGDGCLLIHRRVMEVIPDPWWEYGETIRGAVDHDMVFSRKVRDHGFSIFLDPRVMIGHIANFTVRPVYDSLSGEWAVLLIDADGKQIVLPAASAGVKVGNGKR